LKRKSLLYVEDDLGSRKVMCGLVERMTIPIHLTIFENSVNFIERVETISPQPDVFLLDIHVLPFDGFDMLSLLRQHERFASSMVVALTASVMNEEVKKLKEAGFDGVLAKPLNFRDFPHVMDRVLAGERIWTIIR
jgi:CheY-like chemotaxis protein